VFFEVSFGEDQNDSHLIHFHRSRSVVFSRAQRFFHLSLLQLHEIVAVHVESSINSSLE